MTIPNFRGMIHVPFCAPALPASVGGSSASQMARMKSQKYTESPFVMKNAFPAT
jgi:hypothetical protein